MNTQLLSEKYREELYGVLHCYDRVIIKGHLQSLCYAKGMTGYLYAHQIRIFDYPQFAQALRDEIRTHAEAVAQENGLQIEFIRSSKAFRKEDRIQAVLERRGTHPGLVHIFAAMEPCRAYEPWHNKATGKTYVRDCTGKCLHYYFYFMDETLGLGYLRVATWCPFEIQFYFNGHNWLAAQLRQQDIAFVQHDNAFLQIADFDLANQLAAQLEGVALHAQLDDLAQRYCPVGATLELPYQWSIFQAEYATDLVFKDPQTVQAFYPSLLEALIQTVQPVDIATFLGRKLHSNYQGELGTRYNHRWLGRRVKHQMGPVSLKLYDKFNLVLRIETTVNNVAFFKHYRQVHHRDGTTTTQWAAMKKTIHSLGALQETLLAVNQRYLKFISAIETPEVGVAKLHRLTETQTENEHRYKGFNLLAEEDSSVLRALAQGEFVLSGFGNKDLRQLVAKNSGQISRLLKRLRVHGLIKKVGQRYKYYLTEFGRQVSLMALKLREMVIIPQLARNEPSA
jgi:hypothetical protein